MPCVKILFPLPNCNSGGPLLSLAAVYLVMFFIESSLQWDLSFSMLHSFCISNKALFSLLQKEVMTDVLPVPISVYISVPTEWVNAPPWLRTTRRGTLPIMASFDRHLSVIFQAILDWLDGKLSKEPVLCCLQHVHMEEKAIHDNVGWRK